jgi:hypothetical protein
MVYLYYSVAFHSYGILDFQIKRIFLNNTIKISHICKKKILLQVLRPVSFTKKTDHHDMTEILLKVALNTINQT